ATATALPTPAVEVPAAAATLSPTRRPAPPDRVAAAFIDIDVLTGGGEFDSRTGRYADNVVAIATPIT
ncbi:MAG TPA: hypothetical protein VJU58_02835, partial [Microbacterium sp.]|nr:hypothetical protein [Microbacterium sp.]